MDAERGCVARVSARAKSADVCQARARLFCCFILCCFVCVCVCLFVTVFFVTHSLPESNTAFCVF